jgi:hypothetical protein
MDIILEFVDGWVESYRTDKIKVNSFQLRHPFELFQHIWKKTGSNCNVCAGPESSTSSQGKGVQVESA